MKAFSMKVANVAAVLFLAGCNPYSLPPNATDSASPSAVGSVPSRAAIAVSPEQAKEIVEGLPEIQLWFGELSEPGGDPNSCATSRSVDVSALQEDSTYFVAAVDHCPNHNSTHAWYKVDATNGHVEDVEP